CFDTRREREQRSAGTATHDRQLLVLHAPEDGPDCAPDLKALAASGFTFVSPDTEGSDPEGELVRLLGLARAVLVYPRSGAAEDPLAHRTLDHARRLGIPALCVCLEEASTERALDAGFDVLSHGHERRADEIRSRVESMMQARPARETKPAPSWSHPEPVTDRPALAVVPFVNLGGDEGSDLLAAGLTEDITTLLSRIPGFFVIAHSTMQVYRDAPADAGTLREQLGVRYLLKGSVRSAVGKVRVTVELVDAISQASLFSERFDRPLDDLFEVQDEITVAICAQLEPKVRAEDIAYGARTASVSAWRLWQEGWHWLFVDAPQPVPTRSLQRFEQAIALESDYALGHAGKAIALATGMLWGGIGPERFLEARDHAETAYKLLPENPVALYAMGMITFIEPVSLCVPLEYIERAVHLEPSNPMYQGVNGYLVANLGDAQRGVDQCLYATRLSPKDSREPFLCYMLGAAYIANEQYELAIETMTRCRRFSEVDFIWLMIAYAHAQLGETDRAVDSLRRIDAPRSYAFYRFAVLERLWLELPKQDKESFLELFAQAQIT
ncbi:MAG: hypothetical protein V2J24_07420, partial [Pseudomonadales bacterium]|nr:hypothetical protein [Pseudomonadales bacterium]